MNSDCKKLFHRFPDHYKGREVSVFKMVDSNYKTNVKRAREIIAPIVIMWASKHLHICCVVTRIVGKTNQSQEKLISLIK